MNRVSLIGRVTKDVEVAQTQSGVAVASFSVAINTKTKDKEFVDFIDCVLWRDYATTMAKYLTKGKEIGVDGSLHTRTYEDKNGSKHKVTEVYVSEITFVGKKSDNEPSEQSYVPPMTDEGVPL